jgi:hypothetical protein
VSLVRLMRLLGPAVLRIGGNSTDSSWWTSRGETPPAWATSTVTSSDLVALHRFLKVTGWRVQLAVDLGHFEPGRIANEAHMARRILGRGLLALEVGNEPDDFGRAAGLRGPTYNVQEYLKEAEAYRQAMVNAAPGVPVYGPALSQTQWLIQMGSAAGMFSEITQHYYPMSTCPSANKPPPTVAELLSNEVRQQEDKTLAQATAVTATAGRNLRIDETNAVNCNGSPLVSPTFASALWSLDWSLRAASAGVRGIDFNGNLGVCGFKAPSPICSPSNEAAKHKNLAARPEYYGLLAASRLEGGRFISSNLISPEPLPNLTTWATVSPDGILAIAIDNMSTVGAPQQVSIPTRGYEAIEEPLTAPSAEARYGVLFGRSYVTGHGSWKSDAIHVSHKETINISVGAASAMVITLRPQHRR